jgi:hypothetical protein
MWVQKIGWTRTSWPKSVIKRNLSLGHQCYAVLNSEAPTHHIPEELCEISIVEAMDLHSTV